METTVPDPLARRRVLDWIASGRLRPEHLAAALKVVNGRPRPEDWRRNLDRLLLGLGVLLALAGLVIFIAANWEGLGRPARFALAESAVVLGVAVGWWQGLDTRLGKTGVIWAAVAVGPLLALIGQTYQTGADPWQLFAAWLALIVPWIAIARSAILVLIGVILANTAVGLAWDIRPIRFLGDEGLAWFILGLNGIILVAWEFLAERLDWLNARWAIRLPALAVLGSTTVLAQAAIFEGGGNPALELLPLPIVLGAGFWAYRRRKTDLVLLSAGCLALVVVITGGMGRRLINHMDFAGFLITGFMTTVMTAVAGIWLRSVSREQAPMPTTLVESRPTRSTNADTWQSLMAAGLVTGEIPGDDSTTDPWPLRVLQGAGGWLGALMLMIALTIPVGFAGKKEGVLVGLGLVLCAANILTLRRATGVIGSQFALALSLAGQGTVLLGMLEMNPHDSNTMALVSATVALGLFFAAPAPVHRWWCAAIASGALFTLLILAERFPIAAGPVALGMTVLLLTTPAQVPWRAIARPLGRGLLAGWAVCFLISRMEYRWDHGVGPFLITLGSWLEVTAILGITALVLRSAEVPWRRGIWLLVAAMVPAALGLVVPGAAIALGIILIALAELDGPFLGLGILSLLGLIWGHYQMDHATPLVVKAAGLAGMGFAALGLWFILRRAWPREVSHA